MLKPIAVAAFATLAAMSAQAAELPVKKVVLYKHGVGFFERTGSLGAGESVTLRFKANEMNDVLKSLTVNARGSAVVGVRYDSNEPLERRLADFAFRLGTTPSLSQILDQFKGAEVRVEMGGETMEGTIVGARPTPATDTQSEQHQLTLLLSSGVMRTVDAAGARSLAFTDSALQDDFRNYLRILAQARNRDQRTLTVETTGDGASSVAARYIVPAPVWKSSYRLVFDDGDQPLLEGWAIVDNTSAEDWESVNLSLVSGMPVSFITELYAPKYRNRPRAELPEERAAMPVIHAGNIGLEEDEVLMAEAVPPPPAAPKAAMRMSRQRAAGIGGARMDVLADAPMEAKEEMRSESSIATTSTGAALGELFEYRVDQPVTVRQGESAMIPFLQARLDARQLIIFNESLGSQHPLNTVEITNSTESTLDGGALTVFEDGAYAGEALFETIKSGDKRLASYAVDLGVRITTAFDSSSKLQREFKVRRGVLTTKSLRKETRTFTINNVDQRDKTVIIEQPARDGYEAVSPEPTELTAKTRRYEAKIPAGRTSKFPIVEERMVSQATYLRNLNTNTLATYVENKELDDAGRQKLGGLLDLMRQIAGKDADISATNQAIQRIVEDQNRIRQNINSLRSVSSRQTQVQEYADRLAEQEGELAELRDRLVELEREKRELEQRRDTTIETLEI